MKNEWDEQGLLFMDLCRQGIKNEVLQLLQMGFQPNDYYNYQQWTPLFIAVKYNQLEIVEILLKYKANVNVLTLNQETPLMHASINGNYEIAKLLLDYNSDINIQNDEGSTALSFACYYGHQNIVELLLKNKADVSIKFFGIDQFANMTAIQIAETKGFYNITKLFKSKL